MPRTKSQRAVDYVRRAAEYQFDCLIRITRNREPAFNESTGLYNTVSDQVYEGLARIWEIDSGGVLVVGNATIPLHSTFCSIPWNHSPVPRNDDTVEVLYMPDDPNLPGQTFRIMAVDGGGFMRATRRMHITGIVENAHFNG